MSSLGELFFSLGLDSQKFDEAIKKAKEKVAELTGEASITINADASNVAAQVQDDLNKITGKKTEIKLGIDKSSKASVEELVKDIANAEKELERLKSKESWNTAAIGRQEGFVANLKRQLEEAKAVKVAATEAKEAISNIAQPSQTVQHVVSEEAIADVKALTDAMKSLNEQMEVSNRLREGQQKANAQSKEEAKQRKISAQWLNETRRKNKEIAQLQKEEEAMRSSVSSKWIDEARQKNAELRKEESAAAKQRVADAKTSNKALQSQLSQLFKLEEAIKKLQNLRIRLNFSGIDQNSENFKKAASALDAYINKLQQLQGSGRALSKREVSSVLGMSMKAVIDESDRYVKEQKAIEKSLIKALSEGSGSSVVVDKKTSAMNKFQKAIVGTTNWASQLNNQLGNAFSIYAIERFIRSLYTVGGEFQKQQIALQNMIGDTAKADVIFDRMKDLAVTSPFTFSELASYTKQMSAYGIEYEELYDTTKRLADISAGVGVDMSRIILAYGQVRSAEVLRGQELRQFTEAGIPLVAELAKRLEEVRGKSVAVGEVFDAISKREISFDMVKDVLFDMTDPGGRFFETQEKLAESLAGKWSNLKDAWDIMIADIANGNNSTLKSLAEVTAWLVKNWETWLPLITGSAAALGAYRTVMAVVIPLQQAFNILTKANPWIAIASGVIGAAAAIYGYATDSKTAADELKELNHELDKNIQKHKENEQTANRYLDSLKAQNTSEEQRIRLLEELKSLYPDIFKDMKVEQVLLADTIELKKKMAKATKDMTLADYDELLVKAEKNRIELQKKYDDTYTQTGATGKRNKWYDQLEDVKAEIRKNKEERAALVKELEWNKNVSALGEKSTLEEYINLYGEIGKAIKILRDAGINNETVVKPAQGIPIDEYYDKLNSALKEQDDIMRKFGSDTSMYKNAEKVKKVYEQAIKSIGGVIGGNQKPTGGKSEAGKAAERDAKAYLDTLKAKLSELGSQWDLYKDLFETTGDKRLSKNIAFDGVIPNFDNYISHLKGLMQEEIQKRGLGISVADLLSEGKEGIAKRVNDKSQTAWTEDVAKNLNAIIDSYNNANKKLREESVRNFIDIIKNSKDFAAQIEDIERNLEKDLKDLRANANGADTSMAEAQLRKNATEAISKVNFEEFKKSSDWVKVFDDLDRVSANTIYGMIDRIEEFAKSTNLSQDEVKQLMDALGKLREKTFDFNPFGSLADAMKRVNELRNMTKKTNAYGVTLYDRGEGYGANRYMTEEEYGNALQSAESDIAKSINGISNKFDDLKNVLDPLVDLFGGADTVFGKIIGGLSNALGGASSMGSSINNLANLKFGGEELGSILGLGGNAGFWGAVAGAGISIATTLMDVFGADYSSYNKMKEEYDILLGVWDSLIERKQKYIDIDYADEGRKVGQEALELLNKQIEAYRILGKERLNAGASAGSHSIGVRIKKGMSEEGWEQYNKAMKSMGLNADWVAKDRMESLFNLSGEQLAELQEKAPVFWAKLDEDVREYLNNIIESNEALEEMRKTLNETLTGTSLDSFYDNYISMLQDLDSSNLEFAQSFEEYLKNAIIANVIGNKYKDSITKLYEDWAAYSDSNKDNVFDLTPEESDALKKAQESLTEQLIAEREALKEAFGWTDSNSASSGLSKGIQGVSEDTANLLASYLNAVRGDVSVERTLVEKLVADDIPRINYLVEAQLTQLNAIASNTLRNANAADKIYDLISRMSDKGGNKWRI